MTDGDEAEVITEIAIRRSLQIVDRLVEPVAATVEVDVERGPGFASTPCRSLHPIRHRG